MDSWQQAQLSYDLCIDGILGVGRELAGEAGTFRHSGHSLCRRKGKHSRLESCRTSPLTSALIWKTQPMRTPFLLCPISSFPSIDGFVGNSRGNYIPRAPYGLRIDPLGTARFIRSPQNHRYRFRVRGLILRDRPYQKKGGTRP